MDNEPQGVSAAPPLCARTLEIVWHCSEREEAAERMGMQGGSSSLVEGITSLDLCPATGRVVTTGGDMCIRMWRVDDAAVGAWLGNAANDMAACVTHVCAMRTAWMPLTARWSPQGEMVATAHCDGKLCLWWRDRASGPFRGAAAATSPTTATASAAAAPSGGKAAARRGLPDDGAPPEEWKDYKHLGGHTSDVYDLSFSPDSRYLVSGAGDGSVVVHDLTASTMPIMHMRDQHSKFCRGVAWDPWSRYVYSFGAGPALQVYQAVPPRKTHGRLLLAAQRRCQGDFLGESCSLAFRRLAWSPDGLFLAAPYGRLPPQHRSGAGGQPSEASIFDAIDAKASRPQQPQAKSAKTEAVDDGTAEGAEEEEATAAAVGTAATDGGWGNEEDSANRNSDDDDDDDGEESMFHCVNLYCRNTPDRLAARLCVRGYSEIRGVLWAPRFLEPLPPATDRQMPVIITPSPPSPDAGSSTNNNNNNNNSSTGSHDDVGGGGGGGSGNEEAVEGRGEEGEEAAGAVAAVAREGAWGPADYRMALAVWTADSVILYTTDSPHRHSDFSDLHMRSITDVAWAADATRLLTASLDGYISVISVGAALGRTHRLPVFSPRPATQALARMLTAFAEAGVAVEDGRSTRPDDHAAANAGTAAAPAASVAVVKKKKKSAAAQTAADVNVNELAAILGDEQV